MLIKSVHDSSVMYMILPTYHSAWIYNASIITVLMLYHDKRQQRQFPVNDFTGDLSSCKLTKIRILWWWFRRHDYNRDKSVQNLKFLWSVKDSLCAFIPLSTIVAS